MIETDRMMLRRWQPQDRAALRAQVADPEVMRYLIPIPDAAAFEAQLARLDQWQADWGFTFWVLARKHDGAAMGLCGLKRGSPGTPIDGRVEIGWRLGRPYWGQGYAREAAQACLDWAWDRIDTPDIWSITVSANRASWGLMERLGLRRVAQLDFDHPAVEDDSPFKRHITYVADRPPDRRFVNQIR
ncbi:MAG: GNAT family N-acetyltransferase [Sphingomonas sp. 28-66-16]|nr:MAG: GNAT family N-acetyltransferase [Sphingomonas sp. 28-66-16]